MGFKGLRFGGFRGSKFRGLRFWGLGWCAKHADACLGDLADTQG